MPNLCGVNQKILSEVLDKVKSNPGSGASEKRPGASEVIVTVSLPFVLVPSYLKIVVINLSFYM